MWTSWLFCSTVQLHQGEVFPQPSPGSVHHQRDTSCWGLQWLPVPGERTLHSPRPPCTPLPPPERWPPPHPALWRRRLHRHRVDVAARSAAADWKVSLSLLRRPRGPTMRQHQQGEGRGWREGRGGDGNWEEADGVGGGAEQTVWGRGEHCSLARLQSSSYDVDAAAVELITQSDDHCDLMRSLTWSLLSSVASELHQFSNTRTYCGFNSVDSLFWTDCRIQITASQLRCCCWCYTPSHLFTPTSCCQTQEASHIQWKGHQLYSRLQYLGTNENYIWIWFSNSRTKQQLN